MNVSTLSLITENKKRSYR